MTLSVKKAQETRLLLKRGIRLLRYGKCLLVIASVLAVHFIGTWLIADWYHPQIDDFTLDVPQQLIDSVKEARGNSTDVLFNSFTNIAQTLMRWSLGFAVVAFMARIILTGGEILLDKFRESRKRLHKVTYLALMVIGLVGIPYACLSGWNQVSLIYENNDHQRFIEKLNEKEVPVQIQQSWSYEYIQAQQAILSGHPDKTKLQHVLKKHSTEQNRYDIPAPVLYAFEMQAFQRPVSDKAKDFEFSREQSSTFWHKFSVSCLSGGILLALAGLLASFTGKKVRSRVKFLKAI